MCHAYSLWRKHAASFESFSFTLTLAFYFDIRQRLPVVAAKVVVVVVVNYEDIPATFGYCGYISSVCTLMELNSGTVGRDQSSRTSFEFEVILVNSSPLWPFLELVYVLISRSEMRRSIRRMAIYPAIKTLSRETPCKVASLIRYFKFIASRAKH